MSHPIQLCMKPSCDLDSGLTTFPWTWRAPKQLNTRPSTVLDSGITTFPWIWSHTIEQSTGKSILQNIRLSKRNQTVIPITQL